MFCLMDASASMTEPLKDLAKRFFMLLHVFLSRYYREVHVVFIRHTSTAAEVDEETFFRGTETGGTVISTRARRDAEGRARALFAGRLEHLRRAGLRRRQLPRRHAALPGAARRTRSCRSASISPTSRPRTASASTTRWRRRSGTATPRSPGRDENFAMRRVASPEDIFPGVPRAVLGQRRRSLRRHSSLTDTEAASRDARATCGPCSTGRSGTSS